MAHAAAPNILVIRRRYLGDVVLLAPVFRNLRRHWPAARITALVEPAFAGVLALNPDVDATLLLPAKRAGVAPWFRFLRALRSGGFTHVLDLDNAPKTALFTRLTGAPCRVALLHEMPPRYPRFYTHLAIDPPEEHERASIVRYYLRALAPLGVPVVTDDVRLTPRAADLAAARALLESKIQNPKSKILLIHPGSRSPFRLWPAERFGEIYRRVAAELDTSVLLIGGPAEAAFLPAIRTHAGESLAVIDQPLPVPQFAALAAQCATLLCHDSGPMHLAAAVGTPVVALFGSQNVALWRPHGERHRVLQAPAPCGAACVAPAECTPGDSYRSYCVRRLSVDEVFAAVRAQLAATPPPRP
ncbi:MAG: glycosyltransferase family 9 protein [Opitutae bacterium]|nr:glycosyltransferase family 9 protein [Opitutae bacterium]